MRLRFERQPSAAEPDPLPLPHYATESAAGMDLQAAIRESITLAPRERALVPTGFAIEIPAGHEGQVRPRSGRALREGLSLVNSPGTIDADYRGEIGAILVNLGQEDLVIHRGDRIAQLVIAPIVKMDVTEVSSVSQTARGVGGFGHTGR